MTIQVIPANIVQPIAATTIKKSTADIARKALETLSKSPAINTANQYGLLLARGAERQIVTSATIHGAGFLGFSALAGTIWGLAHSIPIKIGEKISELSIPLLSEQMMHIPFLNLANIGMSVSGLSALYCLDQLAETVLGCSVAKSLLKRSGRLNIFKSLG